MATLIDRLNEVSTVINEALRELMDIADTIAKDKTGNVAASRIYEGVVEIDAAMLDINRLVNEFLNNKTEEEK